MSKELKTPALKTMLNKVGKTPIDEPEIYAILQDDPTMAIFEIPKFVIERAEKDINTFDNDDLALFYNLVRNKVFDTKYENGSYKSTENTKELENMSFKDRVLLFGMSQKASEIESGDKKAMNKLVKEQQSFIWKAANISKKGLTDWEINLVESIAMAQAVSMAETALDLDLGN